MHEHVLGRNDSFELILEPQHDEWNPALQNQPKTYENVLNTKHVDQPYFKQGYNAFHRVASTLVNKHSIQHMHKTITFTHGIEARSNLRTCA